MTTEALGAPASPFTRARAWLWLTLPLGLLLAWVSLVGLRDPNLYRGAEAWVVQAVAQDFVDLALVLPLLVGSAWLAARGSPRAWLVWLGALSYLVYTFTIYAFAVAHNALFLAYVAVLGCAFWALVGGLAGTDWPALRARFGDRAPARGAGLYLLLPAVLFYLLWLADELGAVARGGQPSSLVETGLLTNPVHVLDMALLLPAMIATGYGLLRGRALAYGLAAPLLINGLLQNLAIACIMLFAARAGLPGEPRMALVFLGLGAISLGVLVSFLRALR